VFCINLGTRLAAHRAIRARRSSVRRLNQDPAVSGDSDLERARMRGRRGGAARRVANIRTTSGRADTSTDKPPTSYS